MMMEEEEEEQRGGAGIPSREEEEEEEEQRGGAGIPSREEEEEEEEQRGGAGIPSREEEEEEEEEQRGGAGIPSREEEEEQRGGAGILSREEEEEGSEVTEVTPPREANRNWNHSNDDVTSCPTEASPEIATETEQSEDPAVTPQKPGSGPVVVRGNKNLASEKLERVRKWSISTYKCTRQVLSEKMGRGSRTVDLDLEPRLELLLDDRRRYDQVTKLTQTLANQLAQVTITQKTLGDAFADLSLKTPTLHVEFGLNAEAQRFLSKSGETLTTAVNSFTNDMNTLINKTIEDTLINVKQYEAARIEYDAYRCDLEELNLGPRDNNTLPKLEQAQRTFQNQREKYQKTRDDLSVKLKLLEENKVKVLNSQLLLLHSAAASHSSSCHQFLQRNLRQAAELAHPSLDAPSWLEDS